MVIANWLGVNPYKNVFVGGSDIHIGLSATDENVFARRNEGLSPDRHPDRETAAARIGPVISGDITADKKRNFKGAAPFLLSSAGLTGVWAERNDRDRQSTRLNSSH